MEAIGRTEPVDVRPAERSRHSIAVQKLGDLPPLTGLRFFAAFFVFVGHATPMMLKFTPGPQPVIDVTNCLIEVGMELFFVLSGFVIHYNYADVGRLPNSQNRDTVGPDRLKWALEWPVTMPRSPFVNNDPSASIPNVKIEFVALGSAIALGLVLVTFYSAFGF